MNDDPRIGLYFAKLRCKRITRSSSHPLPEDTKVKRTANIFSTIRAKSSFEIPPAVTGVIIELANITKLSSSSSVSCFGLKSDSSAES